MRSSNRVSISTWDQVKDSLFDILDLLNDCPLNDERHTVYRLEIFLRDFFENGVTFFVNYTDAIINRLKDRGTHREALDSLLMSNSLITLNNNTCDLSVEDIGALLDIGDPTGHYTMDAYEVCESLLDDIERYLIDVHYNVLKVLLDVGRFKKSPNDLTEIYYQVTRLTVDFRNEVFEIFLEEVIY